MSRNLKRTFAHVQPHAAPTPSATAPTPEELEEEEEIPPFVLKRARYLQELAPAPIVVGAGAGAGAEAGVSEEESGLRTPPIEAYFEETKEEKESKSKLAKCSNYSHNIAAYKKLFSGEIKNDCAAYGAGGAKYLWTLDRRCTVGSRRFDIDDNDVECDLTPNGLPCCYKNTGVELRGRFMIEFNRLLNLLRQGTHILTQFSDDKLAYSYLQSLIDEIKMQLATINEMKINSKRELYEILSNNPKIFQYLQNMAQDAYDDLVDIQYQPHLRYSFRSQEYVNYFNNVKRILGYMITTMERLATQ